MAATSAKSVTIVTVYEAEARVLEALARIGVSGSSVWHAKGRGTHGHSPHGIFDPRNSVVTAIVSAPVAEKLLAWVEDELAPEYPSIAYAADVSAVPGRQFA